MTNKITIEETERGTKFEAKGNTQTLVTMLAEGLRQIYQDIEGEKIDEMKWHIGISLLLHTISDDNDTKVTPTSTNEVLH